MTEQETLEYNKRCAEFLGWKYSEEKDRWNEDMLRQYSFVESIDLKFHSDWNWIMEVVEAINKTQNPKQGGDTTHSTLKREVQALLGKSAKEAVVEAINQFLIWYNNEQRT